VNGIATRFFYDSANILQERNDDGSVGASFLPGLRLDAMYGRTKGVVKTEYLTNKSGTTIGITDAAGNLVTCYSHEPYGKSTQTGAADDNSRAFTGREDDATGLLYYRARYYDPASGRFISEDPIGVFGGLNLYRYLDNDPINFTDPSGLLLFDEAGRYATQWYADRYVATQSWYYWLGGVISSLWTPETVIPHLPS
jgi:RHS repeat-associated protein